MLGRGMACATRSAGDFKIVGGEAQLVRAIADTAGHGFPFRSSRVIVMRHLANLSLDRLDRVRKVRRKWSVPATSIWTS